ncbi:hypothetical protein V5O48_010790, partial [Marasmius crinis-equi]
RKDYVFCVHPWMNRVLESQGPHLTDSMVIAGATRRALEWRSPQSSASRLTCSTCCDTGASAVDSIPFPPIHTIIQRLDSSLTKLSILQAKIPSSFYTLLASGAISRLRYLYIDNSLPSDDPLQGATIQHGRIFHLPHLVELGVWGQDWAALARAITSSPCTEPLSPLDILASSSSIQTLRVSWEFTSIGLELPLRFLPKLTSLHLHMEPNRGNEREKRCDIEPTMAFLRLCTQLEELYIWGKLPKLSPYPGEHGGIPWLRLYHGPLELLPVVIGTRCRTHLEELTITTPNAAMRPLVGSIVRVLMKLDAPGLRKLELTCKEWDGQLMFCVAKKFLKLVSLQIAYENDLIALGLFPLGHLRHLSTFHLYEIPPPPSPNSSPRISCPDSIPDPGLWKFRLMRRELIHGEREVQSAKPRSCVYPRHSGGYRRSRQRLEQTPTLDDEVALRILKKWKRFVNKGSLSEVKLVERSKVWTRGRDSGSKEWSEWRVGVVDHASEETWDSQKRTLAHGMEGPSSPFPQSDVRSLEAIEIDD